VSKFELPAIHFERTVRDKSRVEPTWSKKMTILSKFLESSLNFLLNILKNTTKDGIVREKRGVKLSF